MNKFFSASLLVVISTFGGFANAGLIDTTTGWDGVSSVGVFGEMSTATYGQTFLVNGPDTQLDSWTFYIDDYVNPDFVDFAFYIMDWDSATTRATGSILYQSAAVSTTNNGGFDGMEAITFNTGGLNLVSGNDYIAFISTSELFDGSSGTSEIGSLLDETAYVDGGFFWQDNHSSAGTWDTEAWFHRSPGSDFGDLAFTASFSSASVPEPGGFALLGLGLAGLVLSRKRKEV
ncbi:PEP-CTERM sorting domain-containing protein [Bowmanella sp. Y26]|uniref:PEP-CTERM sorting domain-containing protein n=1 Tax=Bowmanella yangjiangensis TaxID=2811230 RepID=UPI001BDBD900|nr:PEP-CTERM sorting domain-containing protein [Bowmanella yangjiangensis]MBT1062768.1 PEP-CTERM sorting domain-containing protein [Bowmanella yangjiangensis]